MLDHEAGQAARDQVRCGLELSSWGRLSHGALGEGTLFSSRDIPGRVLHLKKLSCTEGDLEGGRDLRQGSQLAAREVTGCPDHPSRGDEGGGGEDTEGGGGQCWQVGAQGSVCSALGLHLSQNFVRRLP